MARQPILDRAGKIHGYELLCRGTQADTSCHAPADVASARVLHTAVMNVGLDTLTGGAAAFINVTRNLLTDEIDLLLPPSSVVLEVLETIDVDDEVEDACRQLHEKGYLLALDDFVPGSSAERLLPYAKYIKVDVLVTDAATRRRLVKSAPAHTLLLAEKVETAAQFEETLAEGFHLFQGYHFCRPMVVETREVVPVHQVTSLRLLEALSRTNVNVGDLEELIKRDASLCLRLLRYVNSAAFAMSRRVNSIHQAVTLIGLDPIRKWVSIWSLAGLNQARTPEVIRMAAVRARACEHVAISLDIEQTGELFLLGLCSLLDVLLQRPMVDVLRALSLPEHMARALLGGDGRERDILQAVIAYERGAFEEATAAAARLGLAPTALTTAFADAYQWARAVEQ